MSILWREIKMVVFDVDGTLYDQRPLRREVINEMFFHYLFSPGLWREILILFHFRRNRERLAQKRVAGISKNQYILSGYEKESEKVEKVVNEWIRKRPIKHLNKFVCVGALDFVLALQKCGIKAVVLSDYYAEEKILAMGFSFDEIISSESLEIDILKPHPAGINFILKKTEIDKQQVLYVGDREDTDSVAAHHAGIDCIIIRKQDAENHYAQIIKDLYDGYGMLDM
ncbi:MAG: FMN phosphatase YigB (HAD superfamily) [Saprospiraceae bacterium]|jgi:FMN phosphatase YigB (HAD superfamily)